MDDLMSRTMVENLSNGINPITGKLLPSTDICSNEEVQEALKIVLEHCTLESYAVVPTKAYKKQKILEKYPNSGAPWSEEEEEKMLRLYRFGFTTEEIAKILKRSKSAVGSHYKDMKLRNNKTVKK